MNSIYFKVFRLACLCVFCVNATFSQKPIVEWTKSYGGDGTDISTVVRQTTDGYIIGGYTMSENGDITNGNYSYVDINYWIIKTSSNGSIQWQKKLVVLKQI